MPRPSHNRRAPARPRTSRRAEAPAQTLTARNADLHDLYQQSVQEPDADLDLAKRVFLRQTGRPLLHLREDFCGTALLAARWISRGKAHTATGIDIDPDPLDWGRAHVHSKLTPDQRSRLTLVQGNVLSDEVKRLARFDAVLALNFSYWCFKQRNTMLRYFRQARAALAPGGLFMLDFFGGSDVLVEQQERTRKKGFTYVWDQHRYDPATGDYLCYIHFEFPDGAARRKAFTYDWRLWTIPELKDILAEAGFEHTDVYLEGEDDKGKGNGVFSRKTTGPADRSFLAYLISY